MATSTARWNHNVQYHRVIFDAIPAGCRRALDVGCGEGTLTRELRHRVPDVVGIDPDPVSIAIARGHRDAGDITYIETDVVTYAPELASFDLVTAVAALHHMDADVALRHLSSLVRPGGVLAVIGLARSSPADMVLDLAAIVPNWFRARQASYWEHPSPVLWPPPESYASMRTLTARVLPGADFRRRLYWRYTVTWVKS